VRIAIGVTTRCTPRKSQPKSYPPDLQTWRLAIATWEKGASRRAQGGRVRMATATSGSCTSRKSQVTPTVQPEEKETGARARLD